MVKKIIIGGIIFLLINFFSVNALDTAHSSIVMDLDTGKVLYKNDINSKRLIASITKILTAMVTIENSDINKEITVGEEVLKMYGTNIYIEVGEKMTIKDLLYGLLLRSGNDASVVLAKAVGKSEENFVKMMNAKAKEIGMKSSTFQNPHGLDEETKNYSTAYDMALLSRYAYQNSTYRTIVGTSKYETQTEGKSYLWYNRNKLLTSYQYCTGGKNGYTPSAGKTLVSTATKNKLNLTIVTLDDPNIYETHKYLYDLMFEKYKRYKIVDKNNFKIDKNFYEGEIYLKDSFYYPLKENEIDKVKTLVKIIDKKGNNNIVGKIVISLEKEVIGEVNIYKKENKKKKQSLLQKIKELFIR